LSDARGRRDRPDPRLVVGGGAPQVRTVLISSVAAILCALSPGATATAPSDNRARPAQKVTEGRSAYPVSPASPRPERAGADKRAIETLIARMSKRYGVERALVQAIVAAESAFDPRAVSRAGAIGLMQVMPATAADYGVSDGQRLLDPAVNVETGVRHLKRLLEKYDNDYGRVIMAYNAGEGIVDRTDSNVTYLETLNYTEAVIRHYRRDGGTAPTQGALLKVAYLRRLTDPARARRLLRQYLKLSLPSVKTLSNLSLGDVDPGLRDTLPDSKPMAVSDPPRP
jgi:hypothetical protein